MSEPKVIGALRRAASMHREGGGFPREVTTTDAKLLDSLAEALAAWMETWWTRDGDDLITPADARLASLLTTEED